jgi:hypothetical protein
MDRKDFYNEVGTNYRYFLDWRHKLLAGYLVTVAGLAIAFSWALTNNTITPLSWMILLLGLIITLVFWGLEFRNRDLYHVCQKAGSQIEQKEGIDNGQGIYTALDNSRNRISHSMVLDILFSIASLGFLVGSIIAACRIL